MGKSSPAEPKDRWTRTNRERRGDPDTLATLLESARKRSDDWNLAMDTSPRPEPDLRKAVLDRRDLRGFNLSRARLNHASLKHAKLAGAQFFESVLYFAALDGADLSDANMTQTKAGNASFVGARLQRCWIMESDFDESSLSGSDLRRAVVHNSRFGWADLSNAKLDGCNAWRTDFQGASLRGASLKRADLNEANLFDADLRGADLRAADLQGANLTAADLRGADLRGADVSGANVWGVRYDQADIDEGRHRGMRVHERSPTQGRPDGETQDTSWGPVQVHHIEVAHFMSLVMRNPKLAAILDATTNSVVLILGRFSGPNAEILTGLKRALPGYGYAPVIFDFDGPRSRDAIEVIATLAGLSRFVIADLSQPRSVPLESHAIVPHLSIPFVPLIRSGERSFSMFDDLRAKYYWVHHPVEYGDLDDLLARLEAEVLRPAERTFRKISRRRQDLLR